MERIPAILLFAAFLCTLGIATDAQQQDQSRIILQRFHQATESGRYDLFPGIDSACNKAKKSRPGPGQRAVIYLVQGGLKMMILQSTKSLPLLKNALRLCTSVFGDTSKEALEAKTYLSWNYGYLRMPKLEYRYYNELLNHYKSDPKRFVLEIADMYNTIGMSYEYNYGDWYTEQRYLDSGKALLESYVPANAESARLKLSNLINFYNSLAISYYHSGNYEDALYYSRKCLASRSKVMPESMENAIGWMTIGRCLYQIDESRDSSLLYLDRAIGLTENDQGKVQQSTYKAYKADLLFRMGRFDEAIATAAQAIDFIKLQHPLTPSLAGSFVQLVYVQSRAYIQKHDYSRALAVCEDAKNKVGHTPGISLVFQILLHTQHATALYANKQWIDAGNEFKLAVPKTGMTFGKLTSASDSISDMAPYEYLTLYKQIGNYLIEKGIAQKKSEDVKTGIIILKKTVSALERQRSWLFEAGVDEGIGAQDLSLYDDLLEALYKSKELVNERQRLSDAFYTIEVSKADLLRNSLLQENSFFATLSDSVNAKRLELKFKFFSALKRSRQTGVYQAPGKDDLPQTKDAYLKYLRALNKKYGFNAVRERNLIDANDPALAHHNGTIINYFLGSKNLYIFVHANGGQLFIRREIPLSFHSDLSFVRKGVLVNGGWRDTKRLSAFNMIMKQWYQWLLGGISVTGELIVIPHRELSQISFEMLDSSRDVKQSKYVVKFSSLRYDLSASIFLLKKDTSEEKHLKMFGGFSATNFNINNPVNTGSDILSEASRGSIQPLPGTAAEITAIANDYEGDLYMNAKPDDFIRNAAKYKILHVATHAMSDQGPNHECVLLFETDKSGNYLVRDIQIDSLQLQARMAVLSACNTGTGRLHSSEGMLSLGRSFLIAGCPSVIMSLWTVNDASTSKIMSSFYGYLQQGQTKSEALRSAQLHYLDQESDPKKRHPYYWAGFIVVGDNSPLVFAAPEHHRWLLWIALSMVILGVIIKIVSMRKKSSPAIFSAI